MITKRGEGDYPKIYRPCRISEVYGQEEAKMIVGSGLNKGQLPQVLMFHGFSGTGKTSLGRIIAMGLNCKEGPTSEPCCECDSCKQTRDGNHLAFQEYNAGYFSGVERMRKERDNFDAAPMCDSPKKIYLFDECHGLTEEAKTVLLKELEDVKGHLQFILCTTRPDKVIETLRNRCMRIEFKKIENEEIMRLLCDVCKCEGIEPVPNVLDSIIEKSEGMPRNALLLLQAAVGSGKLEKVGESIEPKMKLVKSTFGSMHS